LGNKVQEEYGMITNGNTELASQLQFFMETINDLILVVNHEEDFKIEYVNNNLLLEKLGYSQKGILGRDFAQLIHSDDIKKAIKFIKKGIESGERSQEINLLSVKGESIWSEIKVKTFIIGENNIKKSLIILKDISKVKKLEEDLKEKRKQSQRLGFGSYSTPRNMSKPSKVLMKCYK
jgi:PAS domain S-box-containing protein